MSQSDSGAVVASLFFDEAVFRCAAIEASLVARADCAVAVHPPAVGAAAQRPTECNRRVVCGAAGVVAVVVDDVFEQQADAGVRRSRFVAVARIAGEKVDVLFVQLGIYLREERRVAEKALHTHQQLVFGIAIRPLIAAEMSLKTPVLVHRHVEVDVGSGRKLVGGYAAGVDAHAVTGQQRPLPIELPFQVVGVVAELVQVDERVVVEVLVGPIGLSRLRQQLADG